MRMVSTDDSKRELFTAAKLTHSLSNLSSILADEDEDVNDGKISQLMELCGFSRRDVRTLTVDLGKKWMNERRKTKSSRARLLSDASN